MKPLFIPLRREYFEAFENGAKTVEYRLYGPRWNERTCWPMRPVVLSLGYGKKRRLTGLVAGFAKSKEKSPAFLACYPKAPANSLVACIHITLNPPQPHP
jgi:hypothetical protein